MAIPSGAGAGGSDGDGEMKAGPAATTATQPANGVLGHVLSIFHVYQDPVMNQRLLALIIGQVMTQGCWGGGDVSVNCLAFTSVADLS